MDTNIFICQLSNRQQEKIKNIVIKYCIKQGYDEEETKEMIINVMEDRLCLLEEIEVDTVGFLRSTNVIKISNTRAI